MGVDADLGSLSANEAACVTGVPLQQVHRIIDIGLPGRAAEKRAGSRKAISDGLECIRLAHETTETLTLGGHRRLVRYWSGTRAVPTGRAGGCLARSGGSVPRVPRPGTP